LPREQAFQLLRELIEVPPSNDPERLLEIVLLQNVQVPLAGNAQPVANPTVKRAAAEAPPTASTKPPVPTEPTPQAQADRRA